VNIVGRVDSLWRYPVKSMRGEELRQAFAGFSGVYGDRVYAFRSSAAPNGFPYLTAREHQKMLAYRPVYRYPEKMVAPPNLADAEALAPGVTPVYADSADACVDVETPEGKRIAIDDPQLMQTLRGEIRERHELTLLRSDRALTDCRPLSIFSINTVRTLSHELGSELDKRRFRANVYIELESGEGFGENTFTGHTLRIGRKAVIAVVDRDPRCKMITLDPDNGEANPEVMRRVAREHEGTAGVYGAVLVEGIIRTGDEILLLA